MDDRVAHLERTGPVQENDLVLGQLSGRVPPGRYEGLNRVRVAVGHADAGVQPQPVLVAELLPQHPQPALLGSTPVVAGRRGGRRPVLVRVDVVETVRRRRRPPPPPPGVALLGTVGPGHPAQHAPRRPGPVLVGARTARPLVPPVRLGGHRSVDVVVDGLRRLGGAGRVPLGRRPTRIALGDVHVHAQRTHAVMATAAAIAAAIYAAATAAAWGEFLAGGEALRALGGPLPVQVGAQVTRPLARVGRATTRAAAAAAAGERVARGDEGRHLVNVLLVVHGVADQLQGPWCATQRASLGNREVLVRAVFARPLSRVAHGSPCSLHLRNRKRNYFKTFLNISKTNWPNLKQMILAKCKCKNVLQLRGVSAQLT